MSDIPREVEREFEEQLDRYIENYTGELEKSIKDAESKRDS